MRVAIGKALVLGAAVLVGGCASLATYIEPAVKGKRDAELARVYESGQVQIMSIDGVAVADRNALAGTRVLLLAPGPRALLGRVTYNADMALFSPSEGNFALNGTLVAGREYQITLVRRTGGQTQYLITLVDVETNKVLSGVVVRQPASTQPN